MKAFKTTKGTELPLIDLKGKEYLEVKWRLVWFREEHPSWSIETEFVKLEAAIATAKAAIRDQNGRIIATGHKTEDKQGFGDFAEKAETGAIGRALALCGFGTQFCADDLEEGARIVDAPVEKKKSPGGDLGTRLGLKKPQVLPKSQTPAPAQAQAPSSPPEDSARETQNRRIMASYKEFLTHYGHNMQEFLQANYGVPETRLMTIEQLQDLADFMESSIEIHKNASASLPKAQDSMPPHPLDDYKITVKGRYTGKRFKDIPRAELEDYARTQLDWFRTNNVRSKAWQEFLDKAEEYLFKGPTPPSAQTNQPASS